MTALVVSSSERGLDIVLYCSDGSENDWGESTIRSGYEDTKLWLRRSHDCRRETACRLAFKGEVARAGISLSTIRAILPWPGRACYVAVDCLMSSALTPRLCWSTNIHVIASILNPEQYGSRYCAAGQVGLFPNQPTLNWPREARDQRFGGRCSFCDNVKLRL